VAVLPNADSHLTDDRGAVTRVWRNFFLQLASSTDSAQLAADLLALAERVADLESHPSGATGMILGLGSVTVYGTLDNGLVQIQLDGDNVDALPGPTYFYGTGPDGAKGWYALGDALDTATLAKIVDPDTGIVSLDLAELPDTGIGAALVKITRDDYGRVEGTEAATTDDLPEGATNLYFTDERAQDAAGAVLDDTGDVELHYETSPARRIWATLSAAVQSALSAAVTALQPGDAEPPIAAGSAAEFWSGSKAFTSRLTNSSAGQNLELECYSGPATFRVLRGGGTLSSPSAVLSGQNMFVFDLQGFDGSAFASAAAIQGTATQNWTAGAHGAQLLFRTTDNGSATITTRWIIGAEGTLRPLSDNAYSIGLGSNRPSVLYAATGTINTSDAREKTPVTPLTEEEIAAATQLAGEVGTFQWLASIEQKGEAARHHVGLTVQRAMEVMQSHGLDPFRYAFICYDSWAETPEQCDEETGEVVQEYRPAGDRYSLRPDQLALFLARGFDARLKALEG
jgi:hypothetical protein